MTSPTAPLSLPAMTLTRSPFTTCSLLAAIQITSGASEMMRMNRFSRSSRPTGPKMRVPRGSPSARRITAAFSSNLMYEPSGRRRSFTVRTMTALTTSPFLTLPPGIASLTVATMVSPIPAYRRPEPPRTRMHKTSLAPVLSATRSRDSCWITYLSPIRRAGSLLDPSGGRAWPNWGLLGLLEDLHQAPALGGAERAGLHDEDAVADSGGVGLVVRLDLAGAADDLAVEGVLDTVLDLDDDGLVHLVADDVALAGLAVVAVRSLGHGLILRSLAHLASPFTPMPSSRSRISV